jgi:hypothetical protein
MNPCKTNLLDLTTVLKSVGHTKKSISIRKADIITNIIS